MLSLRPSLRFVWVPAIAMALVVAALYLVVRWWVAGEIDAATQVRVEQRSLLLAGQLESSMEGLQLQLRQLSRRLALRPLTGPGAADDLRTDLEWLQARSQAFAWIGLATPDGRVVAGTRRWLEGESLRSRPVFANATQGPYLGEFHPALLLKPFLAGGGAEVPSLADLGLPLTDAQGQLRAVLVAHVSREWLLAQGERLVSPPEQSRLGFRWFLLDSQGQPMNGPLPFSLPDAAGVWSGTAVARTGGDHYFVSARPMAVGAERSTLHWTAVVGLRATEAAAPLHAFDQRLAAATLLATAAAALLGFFVSRRLMRPYDRLLRVVGERYESAAAAGDFKGYLDELSRELSQAGADGGQDAESALLVRVARDASQLRHLLDSLPVAVCVLGPERRLLYANALFAEFMFPQDPGEREATLAMLVAQADAAEPLAPGAAPPVVDLAGAGRLPRLVAVSSAPLRPDAPQEERVLVLREVTGQLSAERRERALQDERAALTRQLLQQEKEATRQLALSLHDELGQTVSALRLLFDARQAQLAGGGLEPADLHRITDLLDRLHHQLRSVLADLRPPMLDELGLLAALEHEIRSRSYDPMRILLSGDPGRRWPADVEWCAFMVAREALGNARRHSGADSVDLLVAGDERQLRVSVIDNGRGVEGLADRTYHGHLGLVGMRERAAAIGARLEIESSPYSGTEISLEWKAAT